MCTAVVEVTDPYEHDLVRICVVLRYARPAQVRASYRGPVGTARKED